MECAFLDGLSGVVQTKCQRQQFIETSFPCVAPEQHNIGTEGAHFQYVPVPAVLINVLNRPDVADDIISPSPPQDQTCLNEYKDGRLYKHFFNEVIREGELFSIFLVFYTDELKIVNPLDLDEGSPSCWSFIIAFLTCMQGTDHRSSLSTLH